MEGCRRGIAVTDDGYAVEDSNAEKEIIKGLWDFFVVLVRKVVLTSPRQNPKPLVSHYT